MSELRLLPAALLTWAVMLALLCGGHWGVAVGILCAALGIALACRAPGQAILLGGCGVAAAVIVGVQLHAAQAFHFGSQLSATVASSPRPMETGGWFLEVSVPGYPSRVPLMCAATQLPTGMVPGAGVSARVTVGESSRPGLGEVLLHAVTCDVSQPAQGSAAWAAHARETFRDAVSARVEPDAAALLPGMVVGDTSLQDQVTRQLYIDTGLSHLSAVSGSNVAIVTTAMVLLARAAARGPVGQSLAAALGLLGFVALVGTEPSVIRAAVMGLVGLIAVIRSARMEPLHSVCLAVIALLLWDPDLAVSPAFALSVSATVGIVALSPLILRHLVWLRAPHILLSALAVAIAADVVTMPIIALVTGRVSLVAVLANILAAPMVTPITVLGLIAALLAQCGMGLERPLLWLLEPAAQWIHGVAAWCQGVPHSTIEVPDGLLGASIVMVAYGWLLWALAAGYRKSVAGVLLLGGAWVFFPRPGPEPVDLAALRVVVVENDEQVGSVAAGTQVIVVRSGEGRRSARPTVTSDGVPVLYPARDGPVTLYADGTQHAADGRF
ncbi:ComEC/Rec2 family competence protein [Corynebacterium uropygiale]|uniref:ComEC/Rec2 family competence protein n=1 Tax=Corynebacterium uropygiale TaxID=1775911 RepID=A0A9X1QV29_9CORY|nr:ComEC/Rec2 family competence protein [Corynebacterium uropygiale]MCF4007545.1 ComEC/Rec2 family competence protein [Corynebacterium uropygiale]